MLKAEFGEKPNRGVAHFMPVVLTMLMAALVLAGPANADGGPYDWSDPQTALHSPPFGAGYSINNPSCREFAGSPFCISGSNERVAFSVDPFAALPSWSRIPTPAGTYNYAADCASLAACVSVGYPSIVSSTNLTSGSPTWTKATFATPELNDVSWSDVSCAAGSFCVAVGDYWDQDASGNVSVAVTTTNPGAASPTWTVRQLPIGDDGRPVSVACQSSSLCVITASPDFDGTTILTSANPTSITPTWSAATLPGSDYDSFWRRSLDCPSASFCVAAGGRNNDDWIAYSTNPAAGGATWTTKSVSIDELGSVACSTSASCVIGGHEWGDETNDYADMPTIGFSANLTSASPSWSMFQPAGAISSWDSGFNGASCTSSGSCIVSNSRGQVVSSTNPGGGSGSWALNDVATYNRVATLTCPSTTFCALTDYDGHFATSTAPDDAGVEWKVSPRPAEFESGSDIHCYTASFCAGVGESGSDPYFATTVNPAAETPTWNVDPFTAVENPGYISCASDSVCAVIGETYGSGGAIRELAVTTNASATTPIWSVSTLPSDLSVNELACAADFCAALGYKEVAEDDWDPVIATVTGLSGGTPTWQTSLVPGFYGGKAITCLSVNFCMAIGQIYNAELSDDGYEHYTQVYASSTNPSAASPTWNVGDIDELDAASDTYPDDVGMFALSCPSESRCVTVGSRYDEATNRYVPAMASTDNASSGAPTWTADSMEQTYSRLACPANDLCLAANYYGEVSIGTAGGPTVSISAPTSGAVLSSSPAQLTFNASGDAPVTTACRIDTGGFSACSSPSSLPVLTEGSHTLSVRATDGAAKQKTQSVTFTIDSTAPAVQISSPVSGATLTTSSTQLNYLVSDATATSVTCKLDAATAVSCGSPFQLSGLADGSHTVTVSATDAAGNSGSASVTFSVAIPVAPPDGGDQTPQQSNPSTPPAAASPSLLNTVNSIKPSGRASFSVSCPAGCTLTAKVTIGKKKYALPPVVVAAGAADAAVKIPKSIQKKIAAAKKKAKKSKKKLKVVLTATVTSADGASTPVTVKVKP